MADVQSLPGQSDSAPPPRLLDRQGWSTLLAGALLLPISLTTNCSNDNLFQLGTLEASEQIGVGLHLPPWRRLLAMLNWRPIYDIEQRTKQLKKENERLAALEFRMDALLLNN
jgi:hypothetical protein